eukprot:m.66022 g.66022  ORF g.66022 m.66022 type:complete len:527 (-) comp13572_c0_seq2:508-2088(-)
MRACWCWQSSARRQRISTLSESAENGDRSAVDGVNAQRSQPTTRLTAADFRLVFARKYPSVEERVKVLHGGKHVQVPEGDVILPTVLLATCTTGHEQVTHGAEVDESIEAQVLQLQLSEPPLFVVDGCWPILALQQDDFVVACLPFTETPPDPKLRATTILQSPDISTSLSFLEELLRLLMRLQGQPFPILHSELSMFVSLSCPVGIYDGLTYAQVGNLLNGKAEASTPAMPAWRIGLHNQAKPSLEFVITETVSVSQQEAVDLFESMIVSGVIACRAVLSGKPEVAANVVSTSDLSRCHVHRCVEQSRPGATAMQRNLTFIPPIEKFDLMQYKLSLAAEPLEPPLIGSYTINSRGDMSRLSFTFTLRRSERYTGQGFEHVEVTFPFFNRGCISAHSCRPSAGSILVPRQSHTIIWKLEKYFTGKQVAASLTADLVFDSTQPHGGIDDPFCSGLTAYADIDWLATGKTLSNTIVNTDTIRIQPAPKTKVKATVSLVLKSGNYRIWNSQGASRKCLVELDTDAQDKE